MKMETPTKSQQKIIDRVATLLANGYDQIEHDIESQLELIETKAALIALKDKLSGMASWLHSEKPAKRPYVRKQHVTPEPSLLDKSGVAEAHAALEEQAPAARRPKPTKGKKETAEEIKDNIENLDGVIDL